MNLTLCGSTRFKKTFDEVSYRLTTSGHVVYGLGCYGRQENDTGKDGNILVTEEQKIMLDLVHLAKIDNSEAILVLNVHQYIGYSTTKEIMWAKIRDKKIFWLEVPGYEIREKFKVWSINIWPPKEMENLPAEDNPFI